MAVLQTCGLAKRFGDSEVRCPDLSMSPGESVALVGHDSTGKTACCRMISGAMRPDRGAILLDGKDATSWPARRRVHEGRLAVYVSPSGAPFRMLTVEQNLILFSQLLGLTDATGRDRRRELMERFSLSNVRAIAAGDLSNGERRRLEIARLLLLAPAIVVLDEPYEGVDPITTQSLQASLQAISEAGIAFLMTATHAREISPFIDTVVELECERAED